MHRRNSRRRLADRTCPGCGSVSATHCGHLSHLRSCARWKLKTAKGVNKIPTVTDEMLEKIIAVAVAPVAVLFTAGDEPDRTCIVRVRFGAVALELDARVIFIQLSAVENPTEAAQWMKDVAAMEIVVFRRGHVMARLGKDFTTDTISRLVEAVLADRSGM
jgi:hypothetical protein